jgi:hypothetical protein
LAEDMGKKRKLPNRRILVGLSEGGPLALCAALCPFASGIARTPNAQHSCNCCPIHLLILYRFAAEVQEKFRYRSSISL